MGHFHADRVARLGQRTPQRDAGQFFRPGHQLDVHLQRANLRSLQGIPKREAHPDQPAGHGNPENGIFGPDRQNHRLGMAQRRAHLVRRRVHVGHAVRSASANAADRRHPDRRRTLYQRDRREGETQGGRTGRSGLPRPVQGRRQSRRADGTDRQNGLYGRRNLQRTELQLHFADIRAALLGSADIHGRQTGRGFHLVHRPGYRYGRAERPFQTAAPDPSGRRAQLLARGQERDLDQRPHGELPADDDDFSRHRPVYLDHRHRHADGRHRRRQQYHARDGPRADVRIRHPQGDGRQAVVARQAGPARIGTDHGGLRLRRTDRRRRGHGSGQLFHGPGRRRFAEPIFHVQESHARPVDRRQRHARTDRRRHDRRLRSGSPGRTYQGDRRDEAQQIHDPQPINPNRNHTPRKPCST